LSTVHSAKGTEYDHVLLIGSWPLKPDFAAQEEARRVFYVGMTRARKTLTILDRTDIRPSIVEGVSSASVARTRYEPAETGPETAGEDTSSEVLYSYEYVGMEDIYLGYAGHFAENHPVHVALSNLQTGSRLSMRKLEDGVGLFDADGMCVARLSRKAEGDWIERLPAILDIRVLAMIRRSIEQDTDESRKNTYRVNEWEVPIVEVQRPG
jgi:ATP-dependent DNA helicase RecQ